ncbi:MAG: hypothetical protein EAZ27_06440 [Cytophagales bacterium]|nr:MAG: hypothetical protein EAZ27_06440 [Cytophagales bacterium]
MKINTKIILTSVLALMLSLQTQAQKFMGIGTDKPNPRSVLELKVEDAANFQQGFLPPKLTTAQRLLFSTVAGMSGGLNGMTVYDTDILAYFVWNGTTWGQLALSAGSQTVVGVGGITVTTTGLVISVDGNNFVDINQLITPVDVEGDFTSGFTVLGLNSIPIVGVPSALSPILSFNGTNFVYASLPSIQATSIAGINGALVNGSNATGFTINGQNFLTTADGLSFVRTVTGINGITAVSLAGGNFQIDGSAFTKTVIGLGGIQVGTIVGGFSIDGSNFKATTIVGVSGLTTQGTGSTQSVSGAGMVLASQSLANPIGTSAATYGANPLSRTVIQIPAGVKNIKIVFNAYNLAPSGISSLEVRIGTAPITLATNITSDNVDTSIVTSTNIDVSSITGPQIFKIFGQANAVATGVMLSGYTVYIVD